MTKGIQTKARLLAKLFLQVMQIVNIAEWLSSLYNSESLGALEIFQQTLEFMLWKCCLDMDMLLVMIAVREAIQESFEFSPTGLVFGHLF